jgi:hypothetical protein
MLDPRSREFEDRFRARYEALLPVPAFPGDRTWLDRVCTWEEFRDRGHYVAPMVANMMRADAEEWERAEIAAAPELARLVIEAFAESSGPDTRPR